jgi:hypothetical protein
MRDSQRSKLYTAESVLNNYGGADTFCSIGDAQAWVDNITRRAWYRRRFPSATRVTVRAGRKGTAATGGYGKIKLPPWAMNKAVALHELAHNAAGPGAKHGWRFAATFRVLARFVFGKEAERALVESFRKHKVRYKQPRKVVRSYAAKRPGNYDALRAWQAENSFAALQSRAARWGHDLSRDGKLYRLYRSGSPYAVYLWRLGEVRERLDQWEAGTVSV